MEPLHDVLVDTFLAECEENLAAIEEGLVLLEQRGADVELLHEVFRAAHTLKGNASSFDLRAAARVAHLMEDRLERLRDGRLAADASLVTLLLRGVDVLRQNVPLAMRGEEALSDAALAPVLAELESLATSGAESAAGDTASESPRAARPSSAADSLPGRANVDRADVRSRTLRVGIEKLDRLLNLAGEMAIARGRLHQVLEAGASPELRQALEIHSEADRVYAGLQELVMEVRMVSVGPMFRHHVRTLRDQAASVGKRARLVLEGEQVEADTKIIEYMRDPLAHMIRNAIDHGIEAPEDRVAAGKDPCGTITLRARHEMGNVVFEVSDDGSGLDRAAILKRAEERKWSAAHESPSDEQLFALILQPGFSTTTHVTSMSGRGVGLDVVRQHVAALRGALTVASSPGGGTTVRASVPLTVAMIPGFSVGVAGQAFIVPLEWVLETLELPTDTRPRGQAEGSGLVDLRGEALPYVRLRSLFGLREGHSGREYVVVVSNGSRRAGLVVDVLYGESQTVIKPLGPMLQGLPGISGSAILGNGNVALILEVPALLREAAEEESARSPERAERR